MTAGDCFRLVPVNSSKSSLNPKPLSRLWWRSHSLAPSLSRSFVLPSLVAAGSPFWTTIPRAPPPTPVPANLAPCHHVQEVSAIMTLCLFLIHSLAHSSRGSCCLPPMLDPMSTSLARSLCPLCWCFRGGIGLTLWTVVAPPDSRSRRWRARTRWRCPC